ncbi:hypothetical protein ABZ905_38300 [Streptomyces parvus]
MPRLTELDLSLGPLGDKSAVALLTGQPLSPLARLDLHHHYLSEAVAERVRQELTPHGVEVDLTGTPQDRLDDSYPKDDIRYVAVAEWPARAGHPSPRPRAPAPSTCSSGA